MIIEIKKYGVQLHIHNIEISEFTLGRGSESDFIVNSEDISRTHCAIKNVNNKYYVKDLNSINGVYVDGKRITPGEYIEFNPKYSVGLGKKIQVSFPEVEPVSDIEEFSVNSSKQRVSPSDITRVFTGVLNKKLLKKGKRNHLKKRIFALLLITSFLMGVLYYNRYNVQNAVNTTPTISKKQMPPVQPPKVHPSLMNMPKSGCFYDEEKSICDNLGIKETDYITLHDKEISLVLIWPLGFDELSEEEQSLDENVRTKLVVFRFLNKLQRLIVTSSFKPTIETIRFYGVSADSSYPYVLGEMNISGLNMEEFELGLQQIATERVFDNFESKFGSFYKINFTEIN